MLQGEGTLLFDNFVHTDVGVEVGLDIGVSHDRAILRSNMSDGADLSTKTALSYRHHHLCASLQSGGNKRLTTGMDTHGNFPSAANFFEIPMASWKVSCIIGKDSIDDQ